MKYGKRDTNHSEIVGAFTAMGCSVHDTADVGDDFPDLVIGVAGRSVLIEIKYEDGKLSLGQERFHSTWRGDVRVVRTTDDVIALVNNLRKGK